MLTPPLIPRPRVRCVLGGVFFSDWGEYTFPGLDPQVIKGHRRPTLRKGLAVTLPGWKGTHPVPRAEQSGPASLMRLS